MIARSIQSTQLCNRRTMAAISPRNGTTTPMRFAARSALVMACRLTHINLPFLWQLPAIQQGKLWVGLKGYPETRRRAIPGVTSVTRRRGTRRRSVERRVRRHRREQRELAALAPQHGRPERHGVGAEELVAQRRLDDPGVLGELVLELPRPPAGVAGVHPRAAHGGGERVGVLGVAGHEA